MLVSLNKFVIVFSEWFYMPQPFQKNGRLNTSFIKNSAPTLSVDLEVYTLT